MSNAGWPGEWVTQGGFNQSPGAVARSARCTAGQANCFYFQSPDPRDYFTPHDVAVFLEGVNDLNNSISPATVTQPACAEWSSTPRPRGCRCCSACSGPYGIDQHTGLPATFPTRSAEYNSLLDALAVEQVVSRERFDATHGPRRPAPDPDRLRRDGRHDLAQAAHDVPALRRRRQHLPVVTAIGPYSLLGRALRRAKGEPALPGSA